MSLRNEDDLGSTSALRRGYAPFNGTTDQFSGWITMQRMLMYEQGLGGVMSGAETAPEDPGEEATATQKAAFRRNRQQYDQKNGKLFTRLYLAVADNAESYNGAAAQLVRAHGPIGEAEFGDGRGAYLALLKKYRLVGEERMQELHDQIPLVKVTAQDGYDPSRAIQELRRIFLELADLGDNVIDARQKYALFKALPDTRYDSLKAAIICDQQRDRVITFNDVASRASAFYTVQLRSRVQENNRSRGGSQDERALNTTTHEGGRGGRRSNRTHEGGRTTTYEGGRGGRRGNRRP